MLSAVIISLAIPSAAANESLYGCEELSDGTLSINTYLGNEPDITLPTVLFGHNVTHVGSNAFKRHRTLHSITMPVGYKIVGEYAFMNSPVEIVNLPEGLTEIGGSAFRGCIALKEITIPGTVETIGGGSFKECTSLAAIRIGEGVKTIVPAMFAKCSALTDIVIPSTVTSIGGSAFSECTSLTMITIPESVTSIADNAFEGTPSVTIRCPVGSTAHDYAVAKSIPVSLICDHVHTEQRDAVAPSCTAPGYTGDTWCLDCNTKISSGSPIDKLDHVDADGLIHSDDDGHFYICSCGAEFDREPHTGGEPSCVSGAICDICKTEYGAHDPNNHKNTEVRGAVEAVCGVSGYTGDTWCLDCETMIKEGESTNPEREHVDADGIINSDDNGHFYICSCGAEFGREPHTGGEPSCVSGPICDICKTEYGELNPDIHKNTETRNRVSPTYTSEGWSGDIYCKDCEKLLHSGSVLPKLHLRGDADGDGKVSVSDAIVVLKAVAGWDIEYNSEFCDVNTDGTVSVLDAIVILKIVAGWDI